MKVSSTLLLCKGKVSSTLYNATYSFNTAIGGIVLKIKETKKNK